MEPISLFLRELIEEQGLGNRTEQLNPEDSTLDVAAAMFNYLAKCPPQSHHISSQIEQLKMFYRTASTAATIWEAIINVYKNSLKKKPKNIKFQTDAVEDMISTIDKKLNSTLALGCSLFPKSDLNCMGIKPCVLFTELGGLVVESLVFYRLGN